MSNFFDSLQAAISRRDALARVTHEMRARPQYRASANDEPEPVTFAQIHEAAQAEVRDILRGKK